MQYYNEQELAIRIKEIRDSKEFLSKREDELIFLWREVQSTGGLISERGVIQKPRKEKKEKDVFTIPRKFSPHIPVLQKRAKDELSLELLDEMADREAAER